MFSVDRGHLKDLELEKSMLGSLRVATLHGACFVTLEPQVLLDAGGRFSKPAKGVLEGHLRRFAQQ